MARCLTGLVEFLPMAVSCGADTSTPDPAAACLKDISHCSREGIYGNTTGSSVVTHSGNTCLGKATGTP